MQTADKSPSLHPSSSSHPQASFPPNLKFKTNVACRNIKPVCLKSGTNFDDYSVFQFMKVLWFLHHKLVFSTSRFSWCLRKFGWFSLRCNITKQSFTGCSLMWWDVTVSLVRGLGCQTLAGFCCPPVANCRITTTAHWRNTCSDVDGYKLTLCL